MMLFGSKIQKAVNLLFRALFPVFCVSCSTEGHIFCSSCKLEWFSQVENRFFKKGKINSLISFGYYPDPVLKGLLKLWKYSYIEEAKVELKKIVKNVLQDYLYAFPTVDAVAYIPLHPRKKRLRGFDQAEILAGWIAETLGVSFIQILERKKFTQQQARVNRFDRNKKDFENAFVLSGKFSPLSKGGLRGIGNVSIPARVLLVDDVWTTGTTLRAAAKILKKSGVKQIHACTVAKG